MDPALKTVLSYESMLRDGIPDNPLPIMRFAAYRDLMPAYRLQTHDQQRTYRSLSSQASRARKLMTDADKHVYLVRQMQRQMGHDPGPPPRAADDLQVPAETPEQRRVRLLALDLTRAAPPSAHRRGERNIDAQREREAKWEDWKEAKRLQREARQEQRAAAAAAKKLLADQERALKKSDPRSPEGRTLRGSVVAGRAHARYALSWVDRVVEDILTITRRGRQPARAERHPLAARPLYERPHHPAND